MKPKLKRRFWTQRELDVVQRSYPDQPTSKIAAKLGRTVLSVYQAAYELGLHKTEKFRQTLGIQKGSGIGAAFRFRKGIVPHNKGIRQPGWGPGRMKETQFKSGTPNGRAAQLVRPIGTIIADSEGFRRIKVRERGPDNPTHAGWSKDIWPLLSHLVWEQHRSHVPAHHNIVFRDGDRSNCDFANLECISRGDMARRNAMWNRLPKELVAAIMANGALKRKIRRIEKHGTQ